MKIPFRKRNEPKVPWLFRLPRAFQVSSSLLFLAFFVMIAGLSALFGLSEPSSITAEMSLPLYSLWGGVVALAGAGLAYGIFTREQLIEKFSARILTIMLLTFMAWAVAAVGASRAGVILTLSAIVIFFLEQRICFINVILEAKQALNSKYGELLEEEGTGEEE